MEEIAKAKQTAIREKSINHITEAISILALAKLALSEKL